MAAGVDRWVSSSGTSRAATKGQSGVVPEATHPGTDRPEAAFRQERAMSMRQAHNPNSPLSRVPLKRGQEPPLGRLCCRNTFP